MPDWAEPVVRYILEVGLPATLRVSAISVVGATVVGIVLGTLLTLETLEALTVIGIVYLALVWSLSAAIRVLEGRLALPEAR